MDFIITSNRRSKPISRKKLIKIELITVKYKQNTRLWFNDQFLTAFSL